MGRERRGERGGGAGHIIETMGRKIRQIRNQFCTTIPNQETLGVRKSFNPRTHTHAQSHTHTDAIYTYLMRTNNVCILRSYLLLAGVKSGVRKGEF